jgi:glutaredoxin
MTTVYTKVGCPYCAAAKDDLRARGEGFAEIDILEPGAEAELSDPGRSVGRVKAERTRSF